MPDDVRPDDHWLDRLPAPLWWLVAGVCLPFVLAWMTWAMWTDPRDHEWP